MPHLIAFAGFSRSGKDVFAESLTAAGFERWNFGDVIKGFFNPFTRGQETIGELRERMQAANPNLSDADWYDFLDAVLLKFVALGTSIDAFTENDDLKRHLRRILERGGELIYDWVIREYFRVLDAKWSAGKNVVNTRLVKLPEARRWTERKGLIYLVDRKGWPAQTPWEAENVPVLRDSGFVHATLHNDGTLEDWQQKARDFTAWFADLQETA